MQSFSHSVIQSVKPIIPPGDSCDGRTTFDYSSFYDEVLERKKVDSSYRVFRKVRRSATQFPMAEELTDGRREITIWCSNDYLGMSSHPAVKQAAM